MGGMDVLISRAMVGVVLNALDMKCSALFCVHSKVFFMAEDLLFQNATLPYVMIGSIAPRYICLRQSWLTPLVEFPSMQSASIALEALEAAIFTCSWNLSWGSNHKPRNLVQLVKWTSFRELGVFVGFQMYCFLTRFLVFVKCISSFLTWSIFSPL